MAWKRLGGVFCQDTRDLIIAGQVEGIPSKFFSISEPTPCRPFNKLSRCINISPMIIVCYCWIEIHIYIYIYQYIYIYLSKWKKIIIQTKNRHSAIIPGLHLWALRCCLSNIVKGILQLDLSSVQSLRFLADSTQMTWDGQRGRADFLLDFTDLSTIWTTSLRQAWLERKHSTNTEKLRKLQDATVSSKRKKPHLGACFPIDERSSQNQDLQTAGSRPERLAEQTAMLATLGSQTTDRRPNEKLGQHHGARRRRTLSLRQQQPLHRTNIVRRKPCKTWHLTMTTWMALKWTFKPHLGPGLCQELCCTSRCLLQTKNCCTTFKMPIWPTWWRSSSKPLRRNMAMEIPTELWQHSVRLMSLWLVRQNHKDTLLGHGKVLIHTQMYMFKVLFQNDWRSY